MPTTLQLQHPVRVETTRSRAVVHRPCAAATAALESAGVFGVEGAGHLVLVNNVGAYPAAWRCVDCGKEFWQQFAGAELEPM